MLAPAAAVWLTNPVQKTVTGLPVIWVKGVRLQNPILLVELLKGVYWIDDGLQLNLKARGLDKFVTTRAQSLLIANIAAGENRASRLAKNLGVTRQAISHMLNVMQERGIVEIETDSHDRRAQIVKFNPAWIPMRDAAREIRAGLEAELAKRIGKDAYEALTKAVSADWGKPPLLKSPEPVRKRTSKK